MTLRDPSIPEDVRSTTDTAGLLEITEFKLFGVAYERWFGRGISDQALEPYFVEYMFNGVAPHWVRQFCRQVLLDSGHGDLDPTRYGAVAPAAGSGLRGVVYLVTLSALGTLLLLSAFDGSSALPEAIRGCYFPPCY
jgi:hypothetical protein